ncbi:glycine N-acyltransferase-like protein isoform X1 [Lampetra planeri]
MIILRSRQHLRELMVALSRRLPHSAKASELSSTCLTYGRLYFGLKGMSGPMDVYVDSWPNFQAVVVQPREQAGEKPFMPSYSTFSLNPSSLADLLFNVVEWKKPFMLAGIDVDLKERVDDLAARKNVRLSWPSPYDMFTMNDPATLRIPNSKSGMKTAMLNTSHAELVCNSWKYKGHPDSLRLIQTCIKNGFPNSCVLDASGSPVAWILCYSYGALGIAFVRPDYRKKGLLSQCMAAIIPTLNEDFPLFGYINEENTNSLQWATQFGLSKPIDHGFAWVTAEP